MPTPLQQQLHGISGWKQLVEKGCQWSGGTTLSYQSNVTEEAWGVEV